MGLESANLDKLDALRHEIVRCRRCPRLVAWRERVAADRRRAFRDWDYWGKPVPGFGDSAARIVIVGLAPAAHGGNRTGRVFTGDRSGDFLFAALQRCGLANQPTSTSRDDGLVLSDCYIMAAVRCAPPDNKPTPAEFAACRPFLEREIALLPGAAVFVALGKLAFDAVLGQLDPKKAMRPRPAFGHAAEYSIGRYTLLASYHPSQRNTATGLLTPAMFDEIFEQACLRATPPSRLIESGESLE